MDHVLVEKLDTIIAILRDLKGELVKSNFEIDNPIDDDPNEEELSPVADSEDDLEA